MKSDIVNIKIVYKGGAHGDTNKYGRWIYGARPDGKTVACQNKKTNDGGIRIWSYWKSTNIKDKIICETEFTKDEWESITNTPEENQWMVCNQILRDRQHDN